MIPTRVGYHYTTATNWAAIQGDGLHPRRICKPGLEVVGTWVWKEPGTPVHVATSILGQVDKGAWEVVCLAVTYDEAACYREGGDLVVITHHATWRTGAPIYGLERQAVIVTRWIRPSALRLFARYDVLARLTA